MTDLEQHVNAPGRDKLVKEVKAKIDALDIRYVYYPVSYTHLTLPTIYSV